jgi:Cysteine-rich CPCC
MYTKEQIYEIGERIYTEKLREILETPENIRKMIIVEIETGDYEIDKEWSRTGGLETLERIKMRHPEGIFYGKCIGYLVAEKIPGVVSPMLVSKTFQERRAWFDAYLATGDEAIWYLDDLFPQCWHSWFTCPCCGYPAITHRGHLDYCLVCSWSDEGQDDVDADIVYGGPNSTLTLAQARENFDQFGCKYDKSSSSISVENILLEELRTTYDVIMIANDFSQRKALWQSIKICLQLLKLESRRNYMLYEGHVDLYGNLCQLKKKLINQ